MVERGDLAVVPYVDQLLTQGFSDLKFIEAHTMRLHNAMGCEYTEDEEDMAQSGEIEEGVIRLGYLIKELGVAANRVEDIANKLLGYKLVERS